jgi:DNA-binding protein H-NS
MNLVAPERMTTDELWDLHVEISEALKLRLAAQIEAVEVRLKRLNAKPSFERRIATSERRKYPPVVPKFRNPDAPSETWAGRGKQPRWLKDQLRSGKKINDFRIEMAAE